MGDLSALLALLKGQTTEAALAVSVLFVMGTLWLNSRKINADVLTTVSKSQMEAMQGLIAQNKALADDLDALRRQQKELHADLDKLRAQNARMYQHILGLESLVQHYTPRCDTCPHGPGPAPMPVVPFALDERPA